MSYLVRITGQTDRELVGDTWEHTTLSEEIHPFDELLPAYEEAARRASTGREVYIMRLDGDDMGYVPHAKLVKHF